MYKRNFEAPVTKRGEFTDEDETKCVINDACDKWKGIRCTSGHYRAQSLQEIFSAEKPEATKELRSSWITDELVWNTRYQGFASLTKVMADQKDTHY